MRRIRRVNEVSGVNGRRARVGVLSAGAWSESTHLPTLKARGDVDVVVVSRPDADRAHEVARRFDIPGVETDWRKALEYDLDAVIVSSPPVAHEEQVTAALRAGAHVLSEKPFALTPDSAWRMVDRARESGRQLLVAFGWTGVPLFREARRIVADGRLGRLEHVTFHLSVNTRQLLLGGTDGGWEGAGSSQTATYTDPAVSAGGAAAVSMSHGFGILLWLTGQSLATVAAQTYPHGTRNDLHDAVSASFDGGATAAISCASAHLAAERVEWYLGLYGDRGQLWLDSLLDRLRVVTADGEIWQPDLAADDGAYRPGWPTDCLVDVALGKPCPDGLDAVLAARVVEVTDALYRSAESGRPCPIDRRGDR